MVPSVSLALALIVIVAGAVNVAPLAGAVNDTAGGWLVVAEPAIWKLLFDASVTREFFDQAIRNLEVLVSHADWTPTL